MTPRARAALAIALAALAAAAVFALPPLPQWPSYHEFADRRTIAGIPNFWNVVSNLPFLFAGLAGLAAALSLDDRRERPAYALLFVAIGGVAIGSGYYHLAPDTPRLFWDRLPMAVGFGALLAAVIADRISPAVGLGALAPVVLASAAAIVYWRATEDRGAGDLRPYVAAQLGSLVAVALLLALVPARRPGTGWIAVALGLYGAAKACEAADERIFQAGNILSGHTLKHLFGGAATWTIYLGTRARRSPRP